MSGRHKNDYKMFRAIAGLGFCITKEGFWNYNNAWIFLQKCKNWQSI